MPSNWHAPECSRARAAPADILQMPDPRDILDVHGVSAGDPKSPAAGAPNPALRKFLSVWFQCCHTYGRMHRNKQGTAYEGRCPKCGAAVSAKIGPGGT